MTSDDQLRTFSMTTATPFIMKYITYSFSWGRTINIAGDYIVNGIGVPPDGNFAVVHAFSTTLDSMIFIVREGGSNNAYLTYPNSKNNASLK